jgi:hypothetical protein
LKIWYSLAILVQVAVAAWALVGPAATDSNIRQAAITPLCAVGEIF